MDPWDKQSEKSAMMPLQPLPPAYQDTPPAMYPQPYSNQPVPQALYIQGASAGQSVVSVQPTVFVSAAPLSTPEPDYLCYSIFTLICCCLPLGIAALVFSIFTRNANFSGQRDLAEKNSKTARTLNHVAVGLGIVSLIVLITIEIMLIKHTKFNFRN